MSAPEFTKRIKHSRKLLNDVTRVRKEHQDRIQEFALQSLEKTPAMAPYEDMPRSIKVMFRWVRYKVQRGDFSVSTLRSAITGMNVKKAS